MSGGEEGGELQNDGDQGAGWGEVTTDCAVQTLLVGMGGGGKGDLYFYNLLYD